jgi:spore germination protein
VVEPDDTLTSVGERFGVSPEAIAAANGMPEPGPILAGEELMIPGTTYVVQAGDSLTSIAAAFGVTPAAIMEANGIADASTIYAGREVAIPGVAP